ncbi:MAG: aldehyde ferredoxin oxidoreductase, partial [Firmicutes bacterium]|nr:aldehyde ferredoxin oxidoreductase [Bacillota bacterium]
MKIVRVNMADLSVTAADPPPEYALLAGRALCSRLVADEVPPGCHPLGPRNKLVFAPGLLAGTNAPSSGRLSVGGKSPLTGTIKESNAGGVCGQKLASLGIGALVIEGRPADGGWYVLVIGEGGMELKPAGDLVGKGCYEVNERLRAEYGSQIGVICIGPAGEMRMKAAGVSTSDREGGPGRYAGRGGLGAVMGSKGLKAIVVNTRKSFDAPVADKDRLRKASQVLTKALQNHPVTGQALPTYGTAVLVNIINEAGGLPTRNFSAGRFEEAAATGGEAMAEAVKQRGGAGKMGHPCHAGCVIRCSNVIP